MHPRPIRRALLSAHDKTGLVELARELAADRVELISTGGTRKILADAGLAVRDVAEVTGFPEILGGRVKTLHPKIHAGLLAVRDDDAHQAALTGLGIAAIDLVVCNLYPFEQTAADPTATADAVVEQIDVGGPTMIRAAAKNYRDVVVLTEPSQYEGFLEEYRGGGGTLTLAARHRYAAAAFARTAAYDAAIAAHFAGQLGEPFPDRLALALHKRMPLRYGENPHQSAAFYVEAGPSAGELASAEQIHGKELSFNNLLDSDSAWALVREFDRPAAVVIKHGNPCGAAEADRLETAATSAIEGDPQSAFGGVLAFNRAVDEATARAITEPKRFVEAIIAPDFTSEALGLIRTRPSWKANVRLLRTGSAAKPKPGRDYRRVGGGLLVQDRDVSGHDFAQLRVVSKRQPITHELNDLAFAWRVCKHVKSNAIVLARGGAVVGVGAGQMSRVDSVRIAAAKAEDRARGAVLASDAFFPFRDNVDAAAAAGVTAIIQPGGSVRDDESIAAADEHDLAMVFTGVRHFRH